MAYVADLHIHSRFAQACSGQLNIPNLAKWAKYKGIDLLATGDCLHPLWQKELESVLKNEKQGFYEYDLVKFILGTEVACIYSEGGKLRRIHILIFLPSIDSAKKLSEALIKNGANLSSDGRPILGMSSKKLSEIVFKTQPNAIIIPAHIWTPWFSLYGSNSGYDKFKDCFGEFSDQIYAVETGLSSEPAMNWRVSDLDYKSIVSFSDAHSLPRLGREVTLFNGECNYQSLKNSLKNQGIIGTVEFFPEEGKYHYSGHRNCNVVFNPVQLREKGDICPICNRRLTVGVLQRVEDLADRTVEDLQLINKDGVTKSELFPKRAGFRKLVQLEEIIAKSLGFSTNSLKVKDSYLNLVTNLDSELKILTKTPIDLIAMAAGEKLAEGVKRVREGNLTIEPGFDNTYGKVKIWSGEEEKIKKEEGKQIKLF